ncbi:hypothetical protein [Tritonibacter horizontis]|uniref:Uncharacterized protein n=1 Tax=Tritonibacter horizontis TaxID=1768241 RepID=A0A132BW83_9RHOB|nr:hypothetical protein [Tritonibacter horizontis]KUP92077.1 hypothetical protein TRIHO_30960 [Tritonibacter horizontis]
MTGQRNDATHALSVLDEKLEALDTMTEVNSFLVSALREHEAVLKQMSAEETRDMLRRKARAVYRAEGGQKPNPKALELLEKTLGKGPSAEIIPFPTRRR